MTGDRIPLETLQVASPCHAAWEAMTGDDRVRFCPECSLHVYNLSAMDRQEAEALVREKEGRLCVRYYRRADGTVLTRDCPVGVRALRRRLALLAGAAAGALLTLMGWGALGSGNTGSSVSGGASAGPWQVMMDWFWRPRVCMGAPAFVPPAPIPGPGGTGAVQGGPDKPDKGDRTRQR